MASPDQYPFAHHPCYSESREDLWARIHLPVARNCNVKCIFCDRSIGSSCHTSKPGYSASVMSPEEAVSRTFSEIEKNPRLKIVAISGPGEPLANQETFATLDAIRKKNDELNFCLSSNGILVDKVALKLKGLGVKSISISVSAILPETAAQVYEWALLDGKVLRGHRMGESIISKQLAGIETTSALGISVKVNTILIPTINSEEINLISRQVAESGAILQNIVPLVPCPTVPDLRPPTLDELHAVRKIASKNIAQFTHCKQCRSDVVGIPGADRIL